MTTADEMLRIMPTKQLMALARNALSPPTAAKTPDTIEAVTDALAKQARLSISIIAALAGRKGGAKECSDCPPADMPANERRCTDCPWRNAQ